MSTPPRVHRHEVEPAAPAAAPGPRITVLVSLNFPDLTEDVADLVRRFTRTALAELGGLGASYELVDTSDPAACPPRPPQTDGLLLLGGGDVDSELYGVPGPAPRSYGVDRRADEYSVAAVRAAVAAGLPVFGICRGSQLINLAYGGTLVPDLADHRLHCGGPGEPMFLDEKVTVAAGTRLAGVVGESRPSVRAGHHQAVDSVAPGLVAAARADDGVVEAVEDPTRWVLGVQWHPEDSDGDAAHRRRIFSAFTRACQENRAGQGKGAR